MSDKYEYSGYEIIREIIKLGDAHKPPTYKKFIQQSTIHPAAPRERFVTWKNAVETAGYEPRDQVYRGQGTYTIEELLIWIDTFVEMFDCVPATPDLRDWPGPKHATYIRHFGSVPGAIEAAGYDPRGDSL